MDKQHRQSQNPGVGRILYTLNYVLKVQNQTEAAEMISLSFPINIRCPRLAQSCSRPLKLEIHNQHITISVKEAVRIRTVSAKYSVKAELFYIFT